MVWTCEEIRIPRMAIWYKPTGRKKRGRLRTWFNRKREATEKRKIENE